MVFAVAWPWVFDPPKHSTLPPVQKKKKKACSCPRLPYINKWHHQLSKPETQPWVPLSPFPLCPHLSFSINSLPSTSTLQEQFPLNLSFESIFLRLSHHQPSPNHHCLLHRALPFREWFGDQQHWQQAFQNPPVIAGHTRDMGSIPGSGRSPGDRNGNPHQYSCLKNPRTEELGRLQSKGSKRVRHDWAAKHTPLR